MVEAVPVDSVTMATWAVAVLSQVSLKALRMASLVGQQLLVLPQEPVSMVQLRLARQEQA